MTRRCLWALLILLAVPAWALASGVRATLDRSQVQLGETVTLNIAIDSGDRVAAPDLGPLAKDFDVLGQSSNSSISIVNGRRSAQFTIGIALRPKHAGQLTVPSLAVGNGHTEPLQLTVTPPDPNAAASSGKDVFVEAFATPDHGYVGQQLLLTVRLYFDVNLDRGSLDDPQLPGVEVRKLGKDVDYDAERGGRRYHVLERRYALIPRHAGTLTVPSLAFQGVASNPSDPMDPGDFFGQSGLFGGTTVTAASPAVTLHVTAPPADWGGGDWLPARQLTLALEGLPADGTLHVGQPLNLHMTVQAEGLPAESLPEPSLPALAGATVYPDRPVDSTTHDGRWLQGRRERAFAVVPQRAGTLTIPATTLTWFDVQSGQKQVARIPARTLTVLPGAGGAGPAATPPAGAASVSPAASAPLPPAAQPDTPAGTGHAHDRWRWIAAASLGLWLLSLLAWWWLRRRARRAAPAPTSPAAPAGDARALRQAFMDAARGGDASAQARSLLAWARSERPGLHHLGELSAALDSGAQRAAIDALQRRQYGNAQASPAEDLVAAFADGFAWRRPGGGEPGSPLPPLYPFDLGGR